MPPPFGFPDDLVTHGLEFIPDGLVAAVGRGATVRFMNRRAERVTGLVASEVVGRDVREVLPFQDLEGRSWWDVTNPWGGLATRTGHRERLLVLPTGRELLVSAKYVRSGRGQPVQAVVLGLRSAFLRRRAEKENAALLTAMAHELRSPLTGVKGFSSTLLRNWERFSDAQKRLMLETIEADAERLTRLITELLDASRIDAGALRVHPQPLQLEPRFVAQVERRAASGASRDRFVIDVPEDLGPLWADPDRLEQVLTNLVDNAVRHGRGTVRLAARRSTCGDTPAVDILVSDDGAGIAEQHRELVFSRYWQEGSRHGTGLGLFLVRGLVEAHGGTVQAEDAPEGGALIRATFPDHD